MPEAVLGSQISSLKIQNLRITDESGEHRPGLEVEVVSQNICFTPMIFRGLSATIWVSIPHLGAIWKHNLPKYNTQNLYPNGGKSRALCALSLHTHSDLQGWRGGDDGTILGDHWVLQTSFYKFYFPAQNVYPRFGTTILVP